MNTVFELYIEVQLYSGHPLKPCMQFQNNVGHRHETGLFFTLFLWCIFQIQLSGEKLDIVSSVVDAANVQDCSNLYSRSLHRTTSPCDRNPCLNGGTCNLQDASGRYNCTCQDGFRWED
jgi:hypothetical protein